VDATNCCFSLSFSRPRLVVMALLAGYFV